VNTDYDGRQYVGIDLPSYLTGFGPTLTLKLTPVRSAVPPEVVPGVRR
jgi:hypothetical protein